jgi:hypothetical protein
MAEKTLFLSMALLACLIVGLFYFNLGNQCIEAESAAGEREFVIGSTIVPFLEFSSCEGIQLMGNYFILLALYFVAAAIYEYATKNEELTRKLVHPTVLVLFVLIAAALVLVL